MPSEPFPNKCKAFGKIGGASFRMPGVTLLRKIESVNSPSSENQKATFALALTTAFVVSGSVIK